MISWCVTRTLRQFYWNVVRNIGKSACSSRIETTRASSVNSINRHTNYRVIHSNYSHEISSIRRRLMPPKQTFASSSNDSCDDELIAQMLNSPSIDEVFDLIDPSSALTPEQVNAAFAVLDSLLNKQISSFSWALKEHSILSCLQSFINSESKGIYQLIRSSPEFAGLCSEAVRHRENFNNEELLTTTLSLFKLVQIDLNDVSFVSLLTECLRRQESFNLNHLAVYSDIVNMMKRNGFYISGFITELLHQRWPRTEECFEENFADIIKILNTVGYFMTNDGLLEWQEPLYEWTNRYQDTINPGLILGMMETLSRFSSVFKPELLDLVYRYFEEKCDLLTSWQLLRLAMFVRADRRYPVSLIDKLTLRADQLISNERLRAADVVMLACVYEFLKFPADSRKVVEDLLTLYMDEFDIILLRYLSMTSIFTTSKNSNLNSAYYQQIYNRKSELYQSMSCLLGIVYCLSKTPSSRRSRNLDSVLSRELLRSVMEDQIGQQPNHVATIGRYLLQCFDLMDSNSVGAFHRKLLPLLPNFCLFDIIHLGFGLPKHLQRSNRGLPATLLDPSRQHNYPLMLSKLLAKESLRRKNELRNITDVNLLVRSILLKLDRRSQQGVIPEIIQMYTEHSHSMDVTSLNYTVTFMSELRIYVPKVLERIAPLIISRHTSFKLPDVAQALALFAMFDNRSELVDKLRDIVVEKMRQLGSEWSDQVKSILIATNSLATLQVYSEELLQRVFSLEFLSILDSVFLSDASNRQRSLDKVLLELNQSVLLQCPQVPVPWVCNAICNREKDRIYEMAATEWKMSIYEGLLTVLGGSDYIKSGPLVTPFGHLYDFECHLDVNRKPVPIGSAQGHFRIAVVLMKQPNYSANDCFLLGPSKNMLTQLEILGYTVKQVPYFKLDSLKFNRTNERTEYFESLLFNDDTIEMTQDK